MAYDRHQATNEFTRWSETYDRSILQLLLFGPSHRALIRRIKAVSGDRPVRILDVGCGTGVFAARLRAALPNARVWGVDLVSEMLTRGKARWRQHASKVLPVQGDSERLPFASGSFDVVTCANSFHHYPRQDRAVAEMHRVLRNGGRLMLIDGYRDAPWGYFIYEVCVAAREGAIHHAKKQELREMFTQAGLRAVAQTVFRGPAPFLLTEGVAAETLTAINAPHFLIPGAAARARETSS
jgi:ubiquinone/menaquinone biosynthesis C-methylase UbiE